jgi:hypothetical protein
MAGPGYTVIMENEEWSKLPKLTAVESLKEVGELPIELYPVRSMAKDLAAKWIKERRKYSRQTEYQEDLTAVVLAAALSYATQEFNLPGRLAGNPSNSAIDRIIAVAPKGKVLANQVNGSTLQIVCTEGIQLKNRSINEAILARIKVKHTKGRSYSEGIQLAIFVTQEDWKIKVNSLIKEVEKDKHYSCYWVIAPLLEKKGAKFIVNYLGLEPESRGQGQIIVDIDGGIRARFLGLYLKDGRLDDVAEFVKYLKGKIA